MRLDLYLVENNFFTSRNKAQEEIKQGHVMVEDKVVTKPNFDIKDKVKITINNICPYVSRGGYKLAEAIKVFNLDFNNKVVLDIGASTGGFTDCSLQHGAVKVFSVDVGSNQLAPKLKNDNRVISYENTNILDLNNELKFDIIVMDVSFVSIKHLLDALKTFLNNDNYLVALIKPQFEVGKLIDKGIIKDKNSHLKVLQKVRDYLKQAGLYINKLAPSPIKGGSGNIEFLALISKEEKGYIDYLSVVEKAHKKG